MNNEIYREVYVTRETFIGPISYMQSTNAIPILFKFCDYDIPQGATARIIVEKPSGKIMQDTALISENTIKVNVKTQMFSEVGTNYMQVQVEKQSQILVTFDQKVYVSKNRTEPNAPQSENESSFFQELQNAADAANQAAQEANDAADNLTPEAIQNAVNNYLEENPVSGMTEEQEQQLQTNTENIKKIEGILNTKAPAIYQTASGESLQIEDSADTPMAGLRVFGKSRQVKTTGAQLFDASKLPTKTQSGATVTNNGDGSFTVSGSGNLTREFTIGGTFIGDEITLKIGTLKYIENGDVYPRVQVIGTKVKSNADMENRLFTLSTVNSTVEITEQMLSELQDIYVNIYGGKDQPIKTGTMRPMLYQDGDGTWEPYTGGKPSPSPDYPQDIEVPGSEGSVGVNVTGAQLFDASNLATKTQGNVTITNNGDGSFNISGNGNVPGTNYPSIMLSKEESLKLIKPGTLRLAENSDIRPRFMAGLRNTQTNTFRKTVGNQLRLSIEITEDDIQKIESGQDVFSYCFFDNADVQIVPGTIKPMVYIGGIPQMPWEPYKHQSLTIATPNGLPGVLVDSGGNYTDSDGQQWICDEVDFKRGKYVQRVKKLGIDDFTIDPYVRPGTTGARFAAIVSDRTEKSGQPALCNYFPFNNVSSYSSEGNYIATDETEKVFIRVIDDITLEEFKQTYLDLVAYYQLDTPIETDLSEEELTAYAALRTNYPTTVVTSDSDPEVGIEVEYVADTQKYIDNKFAELAQNLAATQNTLLEV